MNHSALAVIPYSQMLKYFPLHLQQLNMESNGKMTNKKCSFVPYKTGSIIFGDIGTNSQHSFFQFLHQGTDIIPVEFIGYKNSQLGKDGMVGRTSSQQKLLANLFAQSIALAQGKKSKNASKNFSGNRPNHIIFGKKLNPKSLGQLLSYFENKTAFEGFIWDINSLVPFIQISIHSLIDLIIKWLIKQGKRNFSVLQIEVLIYSSKKSSSISVCLYPERCTLKRFPPVSILFNLTNCLFTSLKVIVLRSFNRILDSFLTA